MFRLEGNDMFGKFEGHDLTADPIKMNELVLAYIGDCVYELYVRNLSVESGVTKTHVLDIMSSKKSKASYQASALGRIEPILTQTEAAVVRRARNKKISSKPKNADPMDYKAATAFEALVGFLYLSGESERMEEIIGLALKEEKNE